MKLFILLCIIAIAGASPCTIKESKTYTTTDASVLTSIAYIATFQLNCATPQQNLYTIHDDLILQLGTIDKDTFQISIVKDVTSQSKGDHTLKIYNEEGLALLKKKQGAVELAQVVINHPGAYNGPWLNSEHLAAILGVLVGYLAIGSKGRLLA